MATSRSEQTGPKGSTGVSATVSTVEASRAAPTAARALRVVELLASDPGRAWKLAEIQRRLDFSHGNLHAITATLVAMGHLSRDEEQRTYTLGPALLGLGAAAREAYPAVDVARPHLERLAADLDTETHAATRVGRSLLVVARAGPSIGSGGVRVGARFPLTPPLGSTLMAWAPAADIEAYLVTARGSLSEEHLDEVRATLMSVRRRGYSVHVHARRDRAVSETAARAVQDGIPHGDDDLIAVVHRLALQRYLPSDQAIRTADQGLQLSAPVFGPTGTVELSVGVAFAGPGADLTAVVAAPERLLATAAAVTAALGGRGPDDGSRAGDGSQDGDALRSTTAAPVGSPTSAVPSARRGP